MTRVPSLLLIITPTSISHAFSITPTFGVWGRRVVYGAFNYEATYLLDKAMILRYIYRRLPYTEVKQCSWRKAKSYNADLTIYKLQQLQMHAQYLRLWSLCSVLSTIRLLLLWQIK